MAGHDLRGPRCRRALLPEIRPEFFWAPPVLWEAFRDSVLARFDGDPERAAADSAAVLARLGLEQVRIAIVGAAPCRQEVIGFWLALGVPLDEIHGLSESTPHGRESAAPETKVNASPDRRRDGADTEELTAK
jgi:long-subunit acyl-CoA synthetase (AMP-forming)